MSDEQQKEQGVGALEEAEARVQRAIRAVKAANDELRAARKALNEADREHTRAMLMKEMGK